MFWAFLPIPFQMFPAALFCFFARGNLPLALVAVWISNPLTYAPIFYFEYQFGAFLLSESLPANGAQFEDGALFDSLAAFLTPDKIKILLVGSLATSCLTMIFGYGGGLFLHRIVRQRIEAKARKRARPPCERWLRFAASPRRRRQSGNGGGGGTPSGFCFTRPRRLLFLCPPAEAVARATPPFFDFNGGFCRSRSGVCARGYRRLPSGAFAVSRRRERRFLPFFRLAVSQSRAPRIAAHKSRRRRGRIRGRAGFCSTRQATQCAAARARLLIGSGFRRAIPRRWLSPEVFRPTMWEI